MIAIILVFYFTQLMGASAMPATGRENLYQTDGSAEVTILAVTRSDTGTFR
jgi:hypothetical protein